MATKTQFIVVYDDPSSSGLSFTRLLDRKEAESLASESGGILLAVDEKARVVITDYDSDHAESV